MPFVPWMRLQKYPKIANKLWHGWAIRENYICVFERLVQGYGNFKLTKITRRAACYDTTEHGKFVEFIKPAKLLSSLLPVAPSRVRRAPAHHCIIRYRNTFGSRGPSLSNPTCIMRPALPLVPMKDDIARDRTAKWQNETAQISNNYKNLRHQWV